MTLEVKEITNLNPYCSNKNCHLPNPQILNRLHKESKLTWKQLADIFEISERAIRRHARQSEKEKQKIKQKRGRKQKVQGNNLTFLRDYTITVKVITQKFLAEIFFCSQATICRMLKLVGVTYKKFTYQAIEQLRKKNQEAINHFINITLPYLLQSDANIFFLDETGFHFGMVPRRGYGLKSPRLVYQKPGDKGKNQSLILLAQITSGEKIIHTRIVEGGVNSEKFHQFLTDFNPPNNGKNNCLIMDNLSAHRATKSLQKKGLTTIKELMASKNTEIIFLPSYTPELNPVEPINSILKQHAEKMQARTKDKLDLVIEEKVKFFHQEDLTKYLESSVKECLMKNASLSPTEYTLSADYIKSKIIRLC